MQVKGTHLTRTIVLTEFNGTYFEYNEHLTFENLHMYKIHSTLSECSKRLHLSNTKLPGVNC